MNKQLKRGEVVRRSIIGARGFYYPDTHGRQIMVREDCTILPKTGWNSASGWKAYTAPTQAFSIKDRYGDDKPFMVVWVQQDG